LKITNRSKNTLLVLNASLAGSFFTRMFGLLGRESLKQDEALVLKPCNSIHTFFMRFPIDVIFLDKNNRVVKTLPAFKPFRLSAVYFNAHSVIELPIGVIQSSHTSYGDILILE